jgi:hypothetical protein
MRIQLEISETKQQQLKVLMEKADLKTYSDLFNNAVTLLQWAVRQIEAGRTILSVDQESGKERELLMPFLHVEQLSASAGELVTAQRVSRKA